MLIEYSKQNTEDTYLQVRLFPQIKISTDPLLRIIFMSDVSKSQFRWIRPLWN